MERSWPLTVWFCIAFSLNLHLDSDSYANEAIVNLMNLALIMESDLVVMYLTLKFPFQLV